uniref:Uncharacterized protein n=1 Tax=Magallana gigas TaxID=29159 RepID=A0A8W8NM36_MAGGI
MGTWTYLCLLVAFLLNWFTIETSANDLIDDCYRNPELCQEVGILFGQQQPVDKRFLRFGKRALSGDHYIRFGRNSDDKRFLRFGKRGEQGSVEDDLREALNKVIQFKQETGLPLRKRRSADPPLVKDVPEDKDSNSTEKEDSASEKHKRETDEVSEENKRFMRFGRTPAEDDPTYMKRFMRFGRNPDLEKKFMRFGKDGNEKRFMRFGKREDNDNMVTDDKRFMRFGRDPKDDTLMERFVRNGRSGDDKRFMRFGKRFMRFGKRFDNDGEYDDEDEMGAEKRFMRFGKSGDEE